MISSDYHVNELVICGVDYRKLGSAGNRQNTMVTVTLS